jgi:general secretion pathway protein H
MRCNGFTVYDCANLRKLYAARLQQLRRNGFTLIEVLVVLTIIGVMLAGISLSLDALRGRDADLAIARLHHVLEATAERAQTNGQPIAFELLADGYRFSVLDADGRWIAHDEPPLFTERLLPASLRWGALRSRGGETDRLVFGNRAPRFELHLHGEGRNIVLHGRSTGAVQVEQRGAAPA